MDTIESKHRENDAVQREKVLGMFALATIVANRVGYAFTDEKKRTDDMLLMPWDIYPEMFMSESVRAAESRAEADLDNYKAMRRKHAAEWNARFEEERDGFREAVSEGNGGDEGRTDQAEEIQQGS